MKNKLINFYKNWVDKETVSLVGILILIFVVPSLAYYLSAHYQWVASIAFLIFGLGLAATNIGKNFASNIYAASAFILIFGILGMIFDTAGNPIYNLPIRNFCPSETELIRDVIFVEGENYDDPDVYAQEFSCFRVRQIRLSKHFQDGKYLELDF